MNKNQNQASHEKDIFITYLIGYFCFASFCPIRRIELVYYSQFHGFQPVDALDYFGSCPSSYRVASDFDGLFDVIYDDSIPKENPELANQPSWWDSFKERFVTGKMDAVGGKDEKAKMMADHSYDGITELDNFMPPWLQWVFIGTIAFAVIYFVNYTVLGVGPTGEEEYQEELRLEAIAAEARKANMLAGIDENTVVFDESGAALSSGKSIFESNCAACHAADGGGGVGPNLTDEYWLHGGSIQDVFRVVKYGVVEKGMIPWQDQLSPEEMQQVSSYILTLVGTTPANPKEPQGDLFSANPAGETPVTDSTTVMASIQ